MQDQVHYYAPLSFPPSQLIYYKNLCSKPVTNFDPRLKLSIFEEWAWKVLDFGVQPVKGTCVLYATLRLLLTFFISSCYQKSSNLIYEIISETFPSITQNSSKSLICMNNITHLFNKTQNIDTISVSVCHRVKYTALSQMRSEV